MIEFLVVNLLIIIMFTIVNIYLETSLIDWFSRYQRTFPYSFSSRLSLTKLHVTIVNASIYATLSLILTNCHEFCINSSILYKHALTSLSPPFYLPFIYAFLFFVFEQLKKSDRPG